MSSGGSSSSGGGGNAKGSGTGAGVQAIPATSRKMVQSLKEIVNCPEHEIYAMLKECNMDPNDTVHRLLSQDPFHEVKSRREKKKELKEATESRGRAVSNTLNYGSKGADRHAGRAGSSQFSTSETGILRKPAYKKDNCTVQLSSSTNFSGMQGSDINRRPAYHSDSAPAENKTQVPVSSDVISSSSQPPSGYQPSSQPNSGIQSTWLGVPGQLSMADIVKMGRPKASNMPTLSTNSSHPTHDSAPLITSQQNIKHYLDPASVPLESHHDFDSSDKPPSKISAPVHDTGVGSEHVSHDEWPLVEHSSASGSNLLEPSAVSEVFGDPSISNLSTDKATLHLASLPDEVRGTENDVPVDNLSTDCVGSASVSGRQIQDDRSGGPSQFDNDSFNNIDSFKPHMHAFEHQEGIGSSSQLSVPNYTVASVEDASISVSSAAANLKELSLQEGLGEAPTEDNPAVIIPNHLQVPTADCSHLSFGSFGSGGNAAYPMSFGSKSLKSNLEDVSAVENASSINHSDTRNSKYFTDEPLQSNSDSNIAPRSTVGAGSYDSSSTQQEVMKHDATEATHGHQYSFPTSVSSYASENSAQLNTGFLYAQTNSQMQNLAPLSSVMQAYTNSLQGNLLASTGQPTRESDLPYSPFLATQSMPTKYSNAVSSISGPAVSIPETVKPIVYSMPSAPQTLPGNSIATGPALPPHLTVHPYSQPTLPLGHFANMIGYPFLPQSYTYMPSAFQQAYGSNNTYHQSPAAVHSAGIKYSLPQYKNSVDLNSLPQSAAVASGHGSFGASANNVPGNFPLNSSSTSASTTIRYDDAVGSQYKDNNHFVSLHQNENSGVWVHGPGSRTVPSLPASTYYSFQGQNQQHSGLRQVQQPSQHYGAPGYPNFYHSQAGISQEHQQQNPSDGSLGGSQGQQTKQSHQIWQHSY